MSPQLKLTKESAGRYWIGSYNIVHESHHLWRVWWEPKEGDRHKPRGMNMIDGFPTLAAATDFVRRELVPLQPEAIGSSSSLCRDRLMP